MTLSFLESSVCACVCVFACRYVGICVCVLGLHMRGCMCVSSHKCVSAQWHCPLLRGGRITQPRAEFDNDVLHNAYAECLLICDGGASTLLQFHVAFLLKNKQQTQIHIGIFCAFLALWQISQSAHSRLKLGLITTKWAFLSMHAWILKAFYFSAHKQFLLEIRSSWIFLS